MTTRGLPSFILPLITRAKRKIVLGDLPPLYFNAVDNEAHMKSNAMKSMS